MLPGLFSSCRQQGLFSSCMHGPLWRLPSLQGTGFRAQRLQQLCLVSSVVAVPRLRLHDCGTQTYLLHGVWDFPGSGIKPVSLALAGGFFFYLTTEPPGKSSISFYAFLSKGESKRLLVMEGHCPNGLWVSSQLLLDCYWSLDKHPHPVFRSRIIGKRDDSLL